MRELLEKIEARQTAAHDEADRLREQIAHLTDQLAATERVLERLQITRETLLEIADGDDRTSELLPSAYRQILAQFENTDEGLHAKDVCRALGLGTEPRHTEGTRAKLTPRQPGRPRRAPARPVHHAAVTVCPSRRIECRTLRSSRMHISVPRSGGASAGDRALRCT